MNTLCIIHAYCTARMRNVPYMYACYNDGTITIGGIMTHHGLWAISHPHVQQIGRSPQFVAFLSPFFHRSCCLVAVALSLSLSRSLARSIAVLLAVSLFVLVATLVLDVCMHVFCCDLCFGFECSGGSEFWCFLAEAGFRRVLRSNWFGSGVRFSVFLFCFLLLLLLQNSYGWFEGTVGLVVAAAVSFDRETRLFVGCRYKGLVSCCRRLCDEICWFWLCSLEIFFLSVVVLGGRCCRRCFDSLFRCRSQGPVWPPPLLFQGRGGTRCFAAESSDFVSSCGCFRDKICWVWLYFLEVFCENFAGSLFAAFLCDLLDRSLSLHCRSFLFCLLVNWREKESKEKECSFCFCRCLVVFPFPSLFRQRMVVAHGPVDFRWEAISTVKSGRALCLFLLLFPHLFRRRCCVHLSILVAALGWS